MNSKTSELELFGACNALPLNAHEDDAWLCLAEYGDWPHARGLQRLTRDSAERMCDYFRSLRGRLARRFGGLPVYVGHPDDPGFAGHSGHADTRAYAWVSDLEAREDGLYVLPRWSDEGRKLLSNAFYKFLSPRWAMRDLGNGVYEPVRLLSIGLTNQPNIPGMAIANEVKSRKQEVEGIIPGLTPSPVALLEALGLSESDDPIMACQALREECDFLRQSNDELTAENECFYRLASDHESARAAAEFSLDAEREQRISLLLDQAEAQGRILPNQRSALVDSMKDDLPESLHQLCHAKPVLKTTCLSNALAGPQASAPRRDRFLALVNERSRTAALGFTEAWNQIKQERPELFAQLQA